MFDPDCCGVGSGSMWAPLKHSDGSLKPKEMPFSLQSEEKLYSAPRVKNRGDQCLYMLTKT